MKKKTEIEDGKVLKLPTKNDMKNAIKNHDSLSPNRGSSITRVLPSNINVAQLLAKLETEASIKKLAYLRDNAEKEELQRQCAKDLLDRAWGMPAQSIQVSNIDPVHIDQVVIETTDILMKSQSYLSRPVSEWPDDVKAYFNIVDAEDAVGNK